MTKLWHVVLHCTKIHLPQTCHTQLCRDITPRCGKGKSQAFLTILCNRHAIASSSSSHAYPPFAPPSHVSATQGGTSTCEGCRAIVRYLAVRSRACARRESSASFVLVPQRDVLLWCLKSWRSCRAFCREGFLRRPRLVHGIAHERRMVVYGLQPGWRRMVVAEEDGHLLSKSAAVVDKVVKEMSSPDSMA
jgi:hypothetical protein